MIETTSSMPMFRSIEVRSSELNLFAPSDLDRLQKLVGIIVPRLRVTATRQAPALRLDEVTDYLLIVKQKPGQGEYHVDIIGVACFKTDVRPTETILTFYGIAMLSSGWLDDGDMDAHESMCIDLLLQRQARAYLDAHKQFRIIDLSMPVQEET